VEHQALEQPKASGATLAGRSVDLTFSPAGRRVMLVAVVGTPSPLTYAGWKIVRAIVESVGGQHEQIQATQLEDLRKSWAGLATETKKRVVIVSDLPSTPLLDLIRSSRMPIIVFLDDFEEIVDHLIAVYGSTPRAAIRHTTCVLCALDQVREDRALRIKSRDGTRSLRAFISALCEFLRLQEAPSVADDVMVRLGYSATDPVTLIRHAIGKQLQRFSSQTNATQNDLADRTLVTFLARQYANVGSGIDITNLAWPTELFFQVDPPRDFLEGATELVGPARFIAYGPYMHLPRGSWTVSITIEVSENFSGNHLLVDVGSNGVLAAGETSLPAAGTFGLELSFEIKDPFHSVEVRFQLLAGAIEGKMRLVSVSFRRGDMAVRGDAKMPGESLIPQSRLGARS
jgi:hypothetical protein